MSGEVKFRIVTLDGDQDLFSSDNLSTPRVALSGIGEYKTELDEPLQLWLSWQWMGNWCKMETPPAEDFTNREMTITVSDFTGLQSKH